jgi:hypothetical protein
LTGTELDNSGPGPKRKARKSGTPKELKASADRSRARARSIVAASGKTLAELKALATELNQRAVEWLGLQAKTDDARLWPLLFLIEDFARSGIDLDYATGVMQVLPLTAAQTLKIVSAVKGAAGESDFFLGWSFPAWIAPYFDQQRRPNGYARLRLLNFYDEDELTTYHCGKYLAVDTVELPELLRDGETEKYYERADLRNRFYLTPDPNIEWEKVAINTAITLWKTEGEKKSAKACREGFIAVGLGGVNSYVNTEKPDEGSKRGRPRNPRSVPLRDFKDYVWTGRRTGIVFDADKVEKPQVRQAELGLAAIDIERNAKPFAVDLTCKCATTCRGWDDFLVAHGAEKFKQLPQREFNQSDLLDHDFFMVQVPPAAIYSIPSRTLMKRKSFEDLTDDITTVIMTKNGPVEVPAAPEWIRKTKRRTRLLYDPASPPLAFLPDPERDGEAYNTFPGFPFAPEEDDAVFEREIAMWHELLDHGFPRPEDRRFRHFFECWHGYPLKFPGSKILCSLLIVGRKQGTGKTAACKAVGLLHGVNYYEIDSPERLHAKFNKAFAGKTYALANEVVRSRVEAERLKALITETQKEIEPKGIDSYTIPNCINLAITSNRMDALEMDRYDRRFAVWEWPSWPSKKERDEFFARFFVWLYVDPKAPPTQLRMRPEAGRALMREFVREIDYRGFNPNADAPATDAKTRMVTSTEGEHAQWVEVLHEIGPARKLGVGYPYVATATRLLPYFLDEVRRPARPDDAQRLGTALMVHYQQRKFQSRDHKHTTPYLWVIDPELVARQRTLADIYDYWVRGETISKSDVEHWMDLADQVKSAELRAEVLRAQLDERKRKLEERGNVIDIKAAKKSSGAAGKPAAKAGEKKEK